MKLFLFSLGVSNPIRTTETKDGWNIGGARIECSG